MRPYRSRICPSGNTEWVTGSSPQALVFRTCKPTRSMNMLICAVSKCRNGAAGRVCLSLEGSKTRFNLEKASVLVLDPTPMGMQILVQILTGFGARTLHRCHKLEEAKDIIGSREVHLSVIDAMGATGEGYEFVHWLRRHAPEPNCFSPVVVAEGHTRMADVTRARNCGANFLIKRPLSPTALLERIIWIGAEERGFVAGLTYAGPDRRFRNDGPPPEGGRRWNDTLVEIEDSADETAPSAMRLPQ